MECIFRREDYLELTDAAGRAEPVLEIGREIRELQDRFIATLNPDQRQLFTKLDDLIIVEAVALQDATAQLLYQRSGCQIF